MNKRTIYIIKLLKLLLYPLLLIIDKMNITTCIKSAIACSHILRIQYQYSNKNFMFPYRFDGLTPTQCFINKSAQ
jgi:hypothetical protein